MLAGIESAGFIIPGYEIVFVVTESHHHVHFDLMRFKVLIEMLIAHVERRWGEYSVDRCGPAAFLLADATVTMMGSERNVTVDTYDW